MARIALNIQYNGSAYHGWQIQPDLNTVQGKLEAALSQVADHPVQTKCAGRTDTGVHATGQVVHFDSNARRDEKAWTFGTNSQLPSDIVVRWARQVSDDFHARHSATARHYRYIISNRRTRPAILPNHLTWHYHLLNVDLMRQGAEYLLGTHDFSAFRAVGCQAKSPNKTIKSITLEKHQDMIFIDVVADAFLYHMVRNIVGVLFQIGCGKNIPKWVKTVLDARDRSAGGATAPAYGLYLVGVDYPETFQLPEAICKPFITC